MWLVKYPPFMMHSLLTRLQDLLPAPSAEDLDALDDKIDALKAALAKEKEAHRAVQASSVNMT